MKSWISCTLGTPGGANGGGHYQWEIAAQIIAQKYYEISGSTTCEPRLINNASDAFATCVGYWYGRYVREQLGSPIGASFYQADNDPIDAKPQEVWYDSRQGSADADPPWVEPQWNRFYADTDCYYDGDYMQPCAVPPAYATDFYAKPGSGTIVGSARDLARLFTIYRLATGQTRPANLSSNGGTWVSDGGLAGTRTTIVDTLIPDSLGTRHTVTAVVLANRAVVDGDNMPAGEKPIGTRLLDVLQATGSGAITWPTNVDLFQDVRIQSYFTGQYMRLSGSGTYASLVPLDASDYRQRWRMRQDPSGYYRFVNADDSSGMISNEHNYTWAEYLAPHNAWWSQQWLPLDTGWGTTVEIRSRWQTTKKLHATNQLGYVEQGAYSGTGGYWYLQPVPSGPTTCSGSATSPTCLCRNASGPCACGTAGCPAYWTCAMSWYGTNDGCDCNCGGWDPDCDLPGTLYCHGGSGTSCSHSTLQCQ
jgi:hypothetical protein